MATIVAASGAAGNWSTNGAWVGGVQPTAADDVQITATTTSITIDATALARSVDFTGCTGTITAGATAVLTIGDGTAGASNIALKIPSGMTFVPNAASTITFVSTSATQQTVSIDSGYTMGNLTFNSASNGNYAIIANLTLATASTLTLTQGTLHTDGATDNSGLTHSWGLVSSNGSATRSLVLGTSNITIKGTGATVWNLANQTGQSISAASSTLTFTGLTVTIACRNAGNYGSIIFSGCTTMQNNLSFTCANFSATGGNLKTASLSLSTGFIVTGILTLAGNSSINRLLINTVTVGTASTITCTGATVSTNNIDVQDTTFARTDSGGLDLTNGGLNLIGDCGGNSRTGGDGTVTFTTSAQQTMDNSGSGTWSLNGWTTRVPLPQDDVVITGAAKAITSDMPRLGRNIDLSGHTGSNSIAFSTTPNTLYGSLTLVAGLLNSGTQLMTFAGRGNYTITSAGVNLASSGGVSITAPGGTYTLQDAFSASSQTLTLNSGSFVSNNFNITVSSLSSSNSNTRTLTLGSSTITLTSTSATTVFNLGTTTGLTFDGSTTIIILSNATANTRTIAGGGKTFGTLTYTVAGSTGELDITGADSFGRINFSDATNARSLKFFQGTTFTIRNSGGFNVQGTSGKLMTVTSISGAAFTMTSPAQQSCDYLSLTNSVVDASPKWYAGANSTDNGGNTNWIFTAAPPSGGGARTTGIISLANLQNIKSI